MHFNQQRKWSLLTAFVIVVGHSAAMASEEGRIVTVVGQVTVNGSPAKAGDVVPVGGAIETKNASTASMIFGSENVVKITSNSVVAVEKLSSNSATLTLSKGNIDGVKKMGGNERTAVSVKTDAAVFELTSGRYSVASSEDGLGSSYVAVDGNASVTYSTNKEGALTSSERMKLPPGSVLQMASSGSVPETAKISVAMKKISEFEVQSLRPSTKDQPTNEQLAQQLVTAITDSKTPSALLPSRGVASVDNVGSSSGSILPVPSLPRDPLQTVPGRASAAVSVVFTP